SAKAMPVGTCVSRTAAVQQNAAKAKKPLSMPRRRRSATGAPDWACVKAAKMEVMIGAGVRRPETREPTAEDTPVIARTMAAAQRARTGRSQAGGGGVAARGGAS